MNTVTSSNKKTVSITTDTLNAAHVGLAMIVLELNKAIKLADLSNQTSEAQALKASLGNASRNLSEMSAVLKSGSIMDAEGFNHSIQVAKIGDRVIYGGPNSFFGERTGEVSNVIPTPGGWLYDLRLDDLPGRITSGFTNANFAQTQGDQFRVVLS